MGSDVALDLSGYVLDDGESNWSFPAGTHLAAGVPLWAVADPQVWASFQGASPVVPMGSVLRLGNDGDDVRLLDAQGRLVDAFAYGTGSTAGQGGTVSYTSAGLVYERKSDGGVDWVDTDSADDWRTPRAHRIGESTLDEPTFTAYNVTLYASPDSTFQVLTGLIGAATQRLHLHVYELRSAELADALVAARQAHPSLDLQVLVDGNPVGADADDRHATSDALRRIQEAGGLVFVAGDGRYDDHHLKVLVADDAVAVQSENWVAAGVPQDPSWGNRGWGAVVPSRAMADWFATWMAADRAAWDAAPFNLTSYDPSFKAPPRLAARTGDYGPVLQPVVIPGPMQVTPVVAPDHTQDPALDPIAALVRSARRSVDVQQLDLSTGSRNALGWRSGDALADALVAAHAAGATIRVQAAAPFSASDTGNADALSWLGQRADATTATMERAGIATLHNKGLIVDGRAVVVGSLNGNHHSRSSNREVSLILESPEAAAYFGRLFNSDFAPKPAPRDWSVPAQDLHGLPTTPLPTLLAVLGVVSILGRRRWS